MDMTPHDEHLLYLRDKWAWARHVAPRRARMLAEATSDAEKKALWESFGEESRRALREYREARR